MSARGFEIAFDGALLARGFWLYVWAISPPSGPRLHYVGRTGDNASGRVQSAFNRLSAHLGSNMHSNALIKHLAAREVVPEHCTFRFLPYGPLPLPATLDHRAQCAAAQTLEKALCDAMHTAGYDVLNSVPGKIAPDPELWSAARAHFALHFPKIAAATKPETSSPCRSTP